MKLAEKLIHMVNINEAGQYGLIRAMQNRIAAIEDSIDMRNRMSPEAKKEKEWNEKMSKLRSELADVKSMLGTYSAKWEDK